MLSTPHRSSSSCRSLLAALLLCACGLAAGAGCADVRFDRSPYAIRGLDMIYSEQEDLTFLSWRLRDGADPDEVTFELWQDGQYRALDLEQAFYAAKPYACEGFYLCFQFQVRGEYLWPEEVERPLRSVHVDEGVYAGSLPRPQRVETTFDIDPIAIENNALIDPRRYDWFSIFEVPLKRTYEWQLLDGGREQYKRGRVQDCAQPDVDAWRGVDGALQDRISPLSAWVETPACMAMRPKRSDEGGWVVVKPFTPSAVLHGEQQDYLPREERPPVIYLYLVDLLIKSDSRCAAARELVTARLDLSIGQRTQGSVRLGTFTPTDPATGRPLTGCDQQGDQDYPVRQMTEAIKQAAAELFPQNVRVVLFYLNNVDLPPSNRILLQLYELSEELNSIPNVQPYPMAIGSNVVLGLLEWSYTVGWRPIDDKSFVGDLKGWGEFALPFRTMLHQPDTQVRISAPVPSRRPESFKICAITPSSLTGVWLGPGLTASPLASYYPWPESDVPSYTIGLTPQQLVPNEEYQRISVYLEIEACERFCTMPFRTASGADYESWQAERGVCQWIN